MLALLLAGPVSSISIAESWIRYMGEVPQEAIPDLINACDVVTVPYAENSFNAMSGACKIAEYLSCAKPVVATDIAGHREFFSTVPQSLCRPDPVSMANAIREQLYQPQVAPFPKHLTWEAIAQSLVNSLTELATTRTT